MAKIPTRWTGAASSSPLHENIGGKWKERAYAYNLYRSGEFHSECPYVAVGSSRMTYNGAGTWTVLLHERGLWRSEIQANLRFTMPSATAALLPYPNRTQDDTHSWVCVAPVCDFEGQIRVNERPITFNGAGYHDHNFGQVPLADVRRMVLGACGTGLQ